MGHLLLCQTPISEKKNDNWRNMLTLTDTSARHSSISTTITSFSFKINSREFLWLRLARSSDSLIESYSPFFRSTYPTFVHISMFEYVSVYTNISEKDTRDGRHGVRMKKNEVAAKFFFGGNNQQVTCSLRKSGLAPDPIVHFMNWTKNWFKHWLIK